MSAVYKNLGVEFAYPENWQITEEHASGWPRGVSLQTPEGGFWLLQVHAAANPRELAAEVLNAMRQEYEELEAEPVTELIGDTETIGFDMNFYCLDRLVSARTRSMAKPSVSASARLMSSSSGACASQAAPRVVSASQQPITCSLLRSNCA